MRNLIIENDWHEMDMDERYLRLLGKRWVENQERWMGFSEAFWPKNRVETLKRLMSLETGDNLVCRTVFLDYMQLELMAQYLEGMTTQNKRINVYIVIYELEEEIQKYLDQHNSDITPNTEWYNSSITRRRAFKAKMNRSVLSAIRNHNIYEASFYAEEDKLLRVEKFTLKSVIGLIN